MKPLNVGRGRLDEIGPLNSFYFTLDFLAAHHFIYAIFVFFFFNEFILFSCCYFTVVCQKQKLEKIIEIRIKKMR